jgi:hypothetical protein
MAQSTGLSDLIKEKAAFIEQNMKLTSPTREIDMSLIESIKQRRREQIERQVEDLSSNSRNGCLVKQANTVL